MTLHIHDMKVYVTMTHMIINVLQAHMRVDTTTKFMIQKALAIIHDVYLYKAT